MFTVSGIRIVARRTLLLAICAGAFAGAQVQAQQPSPLLYRYQNRRFGATLRHHLRSLGQALFQELAEAGLRVLYGPGLHGDLRD